MHEEHLFSNDSEGLDCRRDGPVFLLPALAQTITVTGTVTDATGEPLIGASVIAKGTSVGAATDFDGNYSLSVDPKATLIVSYVGYDTQEIPVDGRTNINVVLKENSVMLNEVVAIGYGSVKKSDATGAVSAIKPSEVQAVLQHRLRTFS